MSAFAYFKDLAQGFTVPPPAKGWIVRDAARVARKKAAQERP
jgi:hypothetical protein